MPDLAPEPVEPVVPAEPDAALPVPSLPPASDQGLLVGTWRIVPVTIGDVTYTESTFEVRADGTAWVVVHDQDTCNWEPGNPVFRNVQGGGTSFTAERYHGPCVEPPDDWSPGTITVSPDGMTMTESSGQSVTGHVWTKVS